MLPRQRWLILAIVSSALFLIVVDVTVLYTALPTLTQALSASASEKLWIVNAYALVASGLLLGAGTLGDRVGHKRLFLIGLVVFGLASLVAALAATPGLLIAARAILGVGAAMMMPSTLSIIRRVFTDERERTLAIGVWAAVASGGAALGPVLGGLLLAHFWWGSVFLLNVPVVLIAAAAAACLIPATSGDASRRWDWQGSLLSVVALVTLAYAITAWGRPAPSLWGTVLALVVSVGLTMLFVRRQRRQRRAGLTPLIDFAIFRTPGFTAAVWASLVSTGALAGMELAYTQRLQLVLDFSPLQAAMRLLPLPLGAFVAGPLMGYWLPRLGSHTALTGALCLSALALAAYGVLYEAAVPVQLGCLALLGFGAGATMAAASSTIMQRVPVTRAGMAAAIEETSFELGSALGVTVMGSILSAGYSTTLRLPVGLPDLSPVSVVVSDSLDAALLVAADLPPETASALIAAAKQAFDRGFIAVLVACVGLLCAAALAARARPRSSG